MSAHDTPQPSWLNGGAEALEMAIEDGLFPAAQHTPGPWVAVVQADWPHRQDVYITAQQWGAVARASIDPSMPHMVESQRANLRLISAAPELLAALRELLDSELSAMPSAEHGKEAQDAWADRRAKARNNAMHLIAKTTGSTS